LFWGLEIFLEGSLWIHWLFRNRIMKIDGIVISAFEIVVL
jgi:hypothetical protein